MSARPSYRSYPTAVLWLVPLAAVMCAALAGALVFSLLGYDGPAVTAEIFLGPLVNAYKWPDLALRAAPIILIGAGLAVCFRGGLWNIGAEGQYILGGIGATAVALWTQNHSGFWILPLMMLAAIAAGAAWASIPAFLRTRLDISEVLSTLMLTYVAVQLLNYLVAGVWRSPTNFALPATPYFGESQTLPPVWSGSIVHWGVPITLGVTLLVWLLMRSTLFGFFARVVGLSPRAARYSGMPVTAVAWAALAMSGGIAGLAGALDVSGAYGKLSLNFPVGHGFSAITVVFLARLNPLALIPAGLAVALVRVGGEMAQIETGIPSAGAGIFEVLMLVFLLAGDVLFRTLSTRMRIAARAEART